MWKLLPAATLVILAALIACSDPAPETPVPRNIAATPQSPPNTLEQDGTNPAATAGPTETLTPILTAAPTVTPDPTAAPTGTPTPATTIPSSTPSTTGAPTSTPTPVPDRNAVPAPFPEQGLIDTGENTQFVDPVLMGLLYKERRGETVPERLLLTVSKQDHYSPPTPLEEFVKDGGGNRVGSEHWGVWQIPTGLLLPLMQRPDVFSVRLADPTRSPYGGPSTEGPVPSNVDETLANVIRAHRAMNEAGPWPEFQPEPQAWDAWRIPPGKYPGTYHFLAFGSLADGSLNPAGNPCASPGRYYDAEYSEHTRDHSPFEVITKHTEWDGLSRHETETQHVLDTPVSWLYLAKSEPGNPDRVTMTEYMRAMDHQGNWDKTWHHVHTGPLEDFDMGDTVAEEEFCGQFKPSMKGLHLFSSVGKDQVDGIPVKKYGGVRGRYEDPFVSRHTDLWLEFWVDTQGRLVRERTQEFWARELGIDHFYTQVAYSGWGEKNMMPDPETD